MKISYLLLLVFIISCKGREAASTSVIVAMHPQYSRKEIFRRSYDVINLQDYNDKSKFIALYTIRKRYSNNIVIELTEIANGINLCVKQPVVDPAESTYDSLHSLPFNQLCYWYADQDADSIKNSFLPYQTGRTFEDFCCVGSLDPEIWTVEVFNHGLYSSITKDHFSKQDSTFLAFIFDKVHLYEKNGYKMKY